ncbi:hypothetical protein [Hymenobacter nivis]|uniref:DUF4401 domain-containing protein n=1 Tax=Hymenobacter nivis TaxID=1850093 RepID=A0A502GMV5_9BACT|nr:hypothetical protein [Hymenobacter nivis]TPG62316.1 hypothetical protein EAH73_19140 [Hymenobacter nivis]
MSFKAYPTTWALHEAVRAAATRWHRRQLLTDAQQVAIEAAYPLDFFRPGWLLRLVLFIFTGIGCATATGFLLMATDTLDSQFSIATGSIICAIGSLATLELTIKNTKPYHAGYDNALLYAALLALLFLGAEALQLLVGTPDLGDITDPPMRPLLLFAGALLAAATVRYADRGVAAAGFATGLLLLANLVLPYALGRALLPFLLMLAAAGTGWLVRHLARRPDYFYYRTCLQTVKALALATFYLGGNYLVVREGNAAIGHLPVAPQIPFAPLFYAFTACIPLAYIYYGLRRHDRLVLVAGLLAAAFSVFTLRYYRTLLPPAVAATLAGALLLAAAAAALRYLRTPRHGLTEAPGDEAAPLFNLESLAVAQYNAPGPAPAAGFSFGGGDSGGGGATGQF